MQYVRLWITLLLAVLVSGCQMVTAPPPEAGALESPLATPAPVTGPAEESTEGVYTDPQGRFTVPIPTNWSAQPVDDYVVLASPQEQIQVYLLALPGEDIEAAIEQAWEQVDPDFALEVDQVFESPPAGGYEAVVNISYESEDDEQIVAAGGMLYEGVVYTLLVRADLVALQQRSAQLSIIETGFQATAVEQTDLAGVEPIPLDDALLDEFEAYIADALTRFDVPGAAVAVVQDGEIVYASGFGVREIDGSEPVTPETQMMIGSIGKTMTTMLMAILVDEGLMDWDTPVQDVLPQFAVADPELSQEITMRNLVCACTGVPRRDLELLFHSDELTAEDVIESLQTFQFFTDFGEAFQYSNQLVATGGYAAAAAAGGEYGNLYEAYLSEMQQRIFDPIGMASTTFDVETVEAGSNYAMPHSLMPDASYELVPLSVEGLLTPVAPAGASWSNVMDMARYLITELNQGVTPDGTRVVSKENLNVTWEPQVPVSAEASYGLGWFVGSYKGQPMRYHGGNTLGFTADMGFLPEAGVGIIVLSNAQISNLFNEAVRFRLFEMIFQQPHEADAQYSFAHEMRREQSVEAIADIEPVELDQVEPLLGRYTNDALGEIELRVDDGQFVMDAGEFTVEIRAQYDDDGELETYLTYSVPVIGLPLSVEEGADGNPQLTLGQGAISYTFTRVE